MALYVVDQEGVKELFYVEAPTLADAVSLLLRAGHVNPSSIQRLSEKNVLRWNDNMARVQMQALEKYSPLGG